MSQQGSVSDIAHSDHVQLSYEVAALATDLQQVRTDMAALARQVRKVVEFNKWLGHEIVVQGAAVRQARESADMLLDDSPVTHERLIVVEARLRAVYRLAWVAALVSLGAGAVAVLDVMKAG
jgi:hypothetical protein